MHGYGNHRRTRIVLHVGRHLVPARRARKHDWRLEDPLADDVRRLPGRISFEEKEFITPLLLLRTAVEWEWKVRRRPDDLFAVQLNDRISCRQSPKWPSV